MSEQPSAYNVTFSYLFIMLIAVTVSSMEEFRGSLINAVSSTVVFDTGHVAMIDAEAGLPIYDVQDNRIDAYARTDEERGVQRPDYSFIPVTSQVPVSDINEDKTVNGDSVPQRVAVIPAAKLTPLQRVIDDVNEVAAVSEFRDSWYINIASLTNREKADEFVDFARSRDVDVTASHVVVGGKDYWRLSVRGFASSDEASAQALQIKEKLGLKEFWIGRESGKYRLSNPSRSDRGEL